MGRPTTPALRAGSSPATRSSVTRSSPLPSGRPRSRIARSHGPLACARARASATDAASCTVPAPIDRNRAAIASRRSGWSSTTSTVNCSSRGCGIAAGDSTAPVVRARSRPGQVRPRHLPPGVGRCPPTATRPSSGGWCRPTARGGVVGGTLPPKRSNVVVCPRIRSAGRLQPCRPAIPRRSDHLVTFRHVGTAARRRRVHPIRSASAAMPTGGRPAAVRDRACRTPRRGSAVVRPIRQGLPGSTTRAARCRRCAADRRCRRNAPTRSA